MRDEERCVARRFRSAGEVGDDRVVAAPDELHDPAHRAAPVQVRRAAAQHFDALERGPRHAAPEDPAAERII